MKSLRTTLIERIDLIVIAATLAAFILSVVGYGRFHESRSAIVASSLIITLVAAAICYARGVMSERARSLELDQAPFRAPPTSKVAVARIAFHDGRMPPGSNN